MILCFYFNLARAAAQRPFESRDIDWKLTYVGNAENPQDDQILEELCVGPIAQGVHMFVFQAPAPQYDKIANEDLIGVTVILLSCMYHCLDNTYIASINKLLNSQAVT